jgi:hypothetical protein
MRSGLLTLFGCAAVSDHVSAFVPQSRLLPVSYSSHGVSPLPRSLALQATADNGGGSGLGNAIRRMMETPIPGTDKVAATASTPTTPVVVPDVPVNVPDWSQTLNDAVTTAATTATKSSPTPTSIPADAVGTNLNVWKSYLAPNTADLALPDRAALQAGADQIVTSVQSIPVDKLNQAASDIANVLSTEGWSTADITQALNIDELGVWYAGALGAGILLAAGRNSTFTKATAPPPPPPPPKRTFPDPPKLPPLPNLPLPENVPVPVVATAGGIGALTFASLLGFGDSIKNAIKFALVPNAAMTARSAAAVAASTNTQTASVPLASTPPPPPPPTVTPEPINQAIEAASTTIGSSASAGLSSLKTYLVPDPKLLELPDKAGLQATAGKFIDAAVAIPRSIPVDKFGTAAVTLARVLRTEGWSAADVTNALNVEELGVWYAGALGAGVLLASRNVTNIGTSASGPKKPAFRPTRVVAPEPVPTPLESLQSQVREISKVEISPAAKVTIGTVGALTFASLVGMGDSVRSAIKFALVPNAKKPAVSVLAQSVTQEPPEPPSLPDPPSFYAPAVSSEITDKPVTEQLAGSLVESTKGVMSDTVDSSVASSSSVQAAIASVQSNYQNALNSIKEAPGTSGQASKLSEFLKEKVPSFSTDFGKLDLPKPDFNVDLSGFDLTTERIKASLESIPVDKLSSTFDNLGKSLQNGGFTAQSILESMSSAEKGWYLAAGSVVLAAVGAGIRNTYEDQLETTTLETKEKQANAKEPAKISEADSVEDDMVSQIKELSQMTTALSNELKQIKTQKSKKDYDVATMQSDVRELQNAMDAQKKSEKALKLQLAQTEKKLAAETAQLQQKLEEANKKFKDEKDAMKKTNKKLQKDLDAALASVAALEAEKAELQTQLNALGIEEVEAQLAELGLNEVAKKPNRKQEPEPVVEIEPESNSEAQAATTTTKSSSSRPQDTFFANFTEIPLDELPAVASESTEKNKSSKTRAASKQPPSKKTNIKKNSPKKSATKGAIKKQVEQKPEEKKAETKKTEAKKVETKKTEAEKSEMKKTETKKKEAADSVVSGGSENWNSLSESTLKRKTVKELTSYLEEKGLTTTGGDGKTLKKADLVAVVLSQS